MLFQVGGGHMLTCHQWQRAYRHFGMDGQSRWQNIGAWRRRGWQISIIKFSCTVWPVTVWRPPAKLMLLVLANASAKNTDMSSSEGNTTKSRVHGELRWLWAERWGAGSEVTTSESRKLTPPEAEGAARTGSSCSGSRAGCWWCGCSSGPGHARRARRTGPSSGENRPGSGGVAAACLPSFLAHNELAFPQCCAHGEEKGGGPPIGVCATVSDMLPAGALAKRASENRERALGPTEGIKYINQHFTWFGGTLGWHLLHFRFASACGQSILYSPVII